jgi:hypothetical protein
MMEVTGGGNQNMDETKIKAILLTLVGALEDLAASQAVVIATLREQPKGTVSAR